MARLTNADRELALTKVHIDIRELPYNQFYSGFSMVGISDGQFRHLMKENGIEIPDGEYPNFFFTVDSQQLESVGMDASNFVLIGSSRGIALSAKEALAKCKEAIGAIQKP